jgi:type II secretory pathway component PulF
MKWDEFAFLNQQLAGMLKTGIPLEGALRQLCETMRRGRLRTEMERLQTDLARGTPLPEALAARKLPELYRRMVEVGRKGNDLPGMLTMLADYYHRMSGIAARLKGLMVYPAIVLVTTLALFAFLTSLYSSLIQTFMPEISDWSRMPYGSPASLWLPMIWLCVLSGTFVLALLVPRCRDWLRWRLPAFKEAGFSRFASSMKLMLQNGGQLRDALALMQQLERGTTAGAELERWQDRLADGHGKFADLAAGGKIFPPLFVWLVAQAGEDMAEGFGRAAEIYYARAAHRVEMLLYAALPVAVLVLGALIFIQTYPLVRLFLGTMDSLGDLGGLGA